MDKIIPTSKGESSDYTSLSFLQVSGVTAFETDTVLITGSLEVGGTFTVT